MRVCVRVRAGACVCVRACVRACAAFVCARAGELTNTCIRTVGTYANWLNRNPEGLTHMLTFVSQGASRTCSCSAARPPRCARARVCSCSGKEGVVLTWPSAGLAT
eukprot:6187815-Pleurochrysis_carterae.AAC.2